MKKPELLSPAGSLEKLEAAFDFGADAVYLGLPEFSLRSRINQFDREVIEKGIAECRKRGKKCYLTLNIFAHNRHLKSLDGYWDFIDRVRPDALIISDPGIFSLAKDRLPHIPIHISTQANVTNVEAVKFWQKQGASRIILAREVTLEEVKEIKCAVPDIELECFVHGAMCMSYSGRCVLSKWMTNRSGNLGDCAQPCRWPLHKEGGEDEQRIFFREGQKGHSMEIEEDSHGTYILNSYDLRLLEHVTELTKAGIDSFKIEGRTKSAYYVAIVSRAYRQVIDSVYNDLSEGRELSDETGKVISFQKKELEKLSHRGYSCGFILGDEPQHLMDQPAVKTNWIFCGLAKEEKCSIERVVTVHNSFRKGDVVEIITPQENFSTETVRIENVKKEEVDSAHGGNDAQFIVEFGLPIAGKFFLRRKQVEKK